MQATGLIQSWAGNPQEVGPLYPFVGSEGLMFGICVFLWLLWTGWQMRFENAGYRREERP